MMHLVKPIAAELSLNETFALQALKLLIEEDCTIPFVARYRKEQTGSMDEVNLRDLRDRYQYSLELEQTKERYIKTLEEQAKDKPEIAAKLTEICKAFTACRTKQELEDLYLPYKPKRRTRAMIAKEKGLDLLLEHIFQQRAHLPDLLALASTFIRLDGAPELHIPTAEEALKGAFDILAERISETASYRATIRRLSHETGVLESKKIDTPVDAPVSAEDRKHIAKYENYFDYAEPLGKTQSHRVMAIRRGEAEKILRVHVRVDADTVLGALTDAVLKDWPQANAHVSPWVQTVTADAYKRLLASSIETELRLELKTKAEEEAIRVFSSNLENLLLLPPIPGKSVLGVDPGIRTGSKLAVIDETGNLLEYITIYPILNQADHPKTKESVAVLAHFMTKHKVGYVAIGNGTASREVDQLVIQAIKQHGIKGVRRVTVNEAGASVYSTDDIAREEFPDLDPTIRSAISIARRLQDPLAELVKIDPRSIGVGQYQHDCNIVRLEKTLKETVESCVNRVGVNLNTASYKLLSYVSGIGPTLAKNIVSFRQSNGAFQSRKDLETHVKGFGPKAFQQSAGFLRVPHALNPLDNSAVHPESYPVVELMAKAQQLSVQDLVGKKDLVQRLPLEQFVSDQCGLPTLMDIAQELLKPGRDPREDGSRLTFSDDVTSLTDLKPGMQLKGTVSNVTNFGAFVDIGVHQDGLVHISELSDDFVSDPSKVVSVGTVVDVRVLEVDLVRKRISLSCRSKRSSPSPEGEGQALQRPSPQVPHGGRGTTDEPRSFARPQVRPAGGRPDHPASSPRPESMGGGKKLVMTPPKHYSLGDLLNKFGK